MSPRQWRFFLEDIIRAIEKITRYCSNIELDAFGEDEKTQDAIERNFIVIGEAAAHIPAQIVEKPRQFHGEKCATCGILPSMRTGGSSQR